MYIAVSCVQHQRRDEQVSIYWLALRAIRAGKGQGYIDQYDKVVSRFFDSYFLTDIIQVFINFEKNNRCKAIMKLYNTFGQLIQSKK